MFKADSISYEINYRELTLEQKIGQGGFGVVYKASYVHSDVAVKQLLMDTISKEAAEEFASEAVLMAKLRHANIVQFYGYCVSPHYCIVMEYMPEGSLFSVLRSDKPLEWPERFRIAVDIAKGVAVLHHANILHRDIKSLNVLLDKHRTAKLTDFGLSKVKTETKSHTAATKKKSDSVGTVQWMAPELFERKAVYTRKSDIYSLGITFWELATGKIPFADAHDTALIPGWVKAGERDDIPQDCPQPLADLIQACWATDPSVRPTAEDIVTRLKSVTGELMPRRVDNASTGRGPAITLGEMSSHKLPSESDRSTKTTSGASQPAASGPVYQMNSAASSSGSLRSGRLFDSGDPEAVLKKLKDLFISEDYEGEETKDLEIYNQVLEIHNARLVYAKKKQTHTLCVGDEPLNPKESIKAITEMIKALKTPGSPVPQPLPQPSPAAPSIQPGASPPEKSNLPILTPPPKKVDTPVMPKVNPQELTAFLRLVAEGEQGKAEAMLKQNRDLALVPGDVTDLSKRTFRGITAFQYAVWALDWHMWTMLLKYIPPDQARAQALQFDTGTWVRDHGQNATWQNLIDAQQAFLDYCNQEKWSEARDTWVKQVGGAQLLLPAHVVNEYCRPDRSFSPCPDFSKPEQNDAWRIRTTDEGEWFTAQYNGGGLGSGFGVCRGGERQPDVLWAWREGLECLLPGRDHQAVVTLFSTRQKQRDALLSDLVLDHAPAKVAAKR